LKQTTPQQPAEHTRSTAHKNAMSTITRVDVSEVEAIIRDARRVVEYMADPTMISRFPKSLFVPRPKGQDGYETSLRHFHRFVIEILAETRRKICPRWKEAITSLIVGGGADCHSWVGAEVCHKALANAFHETRPIGWLVSHWCKTIDDYFCRADVAAKIVADPQQDKYWRNAGSPVLWIEPPRDEDDRKLVPQAMAKRDDGLWLLENGWLHRCPITRSKVLSADRSKTYGHSLVEFYVGELRKKEVVEKAIRLEVWAREFHTFE